MESEIISMNFSYSITSKSTYLFCTLNRSLLHAWFFLTLCSGHLEKIGHLDMQIFQVLKHSLYDIQKKKSHLLIWSQVSSEKALNIEKLSSTWKQTQVSKLILTWNLEFYRWWQILSVVSLKLTSSLNSFSGKYLSNAYVWTTEMCLSVILSIKNGFPLF